MSDSDTVLGRRLGRCLLVERIGGGGMGSVYRARHEVLDKDVAVKVIAPALRGDPQLVQRLLREARLAARIDHPGVVTVQDAGIEEGTPYLVMPYVRGKSLDAVLAERGKLKPADALAAVKKAARALAAAHRLGIVHRDIKPANLMATTDGQIKVTDFGLAMAVGGGDPRLTQPDCVVGSPHFMAPEQVTGGAVDARTDVYALGATLYTLLGGEPPYGGGTALSVALKHASANERPRPLRDILPGLSPEIESLVGRMMAKRSEDRLPDMESVIRAIEAVQGASRGPAAPPVPAAAAAAPPASAPAGLRRARRLRWALIGVGGAVALVLLVLFLRLPSKARRALQEADRFAAAASGAAQLDDAARRYRGVAEAHPGTREAVLAGERRAEVEKRAADAADAGALAALAAIDASTPAGRLRLESGADAFFRRTPPPSAARAVEARRLVHDAHRRAVEARCRALLDHMRRGDVKGLSAYYDPEEVRGPLQHLGINLAMTAVFNSFKKEGWRLSDYSIDEVSLDPPARKAAVRFRLHLRQEGSGQARDLPDTQTWVLRKGEWYLVPEDKGKK